MADNKSRKRRPSDMVKRTVPRSEWYANIVKSMGFATQDIVKEIFPNTYDFIEYNNSSETFKMIQDMRRNTTSRNIMTNQLENLPQINIARDFLNNALDDIRSGKIVNKERESEFFDGDNMDIGFGGLFDDDGPMFDNFDDGESDSVEFDDGNTIINNNTVNNVINTSPLGKVMAANTEATVNAMSAISEQTLAIETEKMMLSQKSSTQILGGLSALNDNLAAMITFQNDSTAKYYAASIGYYDDSLRILKEAIEHLKYTPIEGSSGDDDSYSDPKNDLYTSKGSLKVDKYFQSIKKNIEDIRDESMVLSSAWDMFNSADDLRSFAANPLKGMMTGFVKTFIPAIASTTLGALDESISNIIPALIAKANSMEDSDNPLFQYLNKIFGTKNSLSYNIDLGSYEKGAIPWDGESKKALVEVIPTYLRRIESALTGREERIFDYNSGKFVNIEDIKSSYEEAVHDKEVSGYTSLKYKMEDIAKGMTDNADILEQFEKDLNEYFRGMTKKGSIIKPFAYKDKDGDVIDELKDNGYFDGSDDRLQFMRNVFKGLSNSDLIKMQTMGIMDSRRATSEFIESINANPNIIGYNNIANNSLYDEYGRLTYKAGLGGTADKYGVTQLDYLRDIRTLLSNGIIVFPETRLPGQSSHIGKIKRRTRQEENNYAEEQRRLALENNTTPRDLTDDYLNLNAELTDEKLKSIYKAVADAEATEWNKGDKWVGKKIAKMPGFSKLANILNEASEVIDDVTFKLVFGSNEEDVEGISIKDRLQNVRENLTENFNGRTSIVHSLIGNVTDIFKGVGSYFTGRDYLTYDGKLVKGEGKGGFLKKVFNFFNDGIDNLFRKQDDSSDVGLIGKFTSNFMDGFREFKTTIFGEARLTDRDKAETISGLTEKIKTRLPKAIGSGITGAVVKTMFASKLGLLGSILLPGGPLGAAITGTAYGFLSQSETFKKWLFGNKDQNGERMGGFIPKSMVDMIEQNGGVVKKGAIIGAGVGLLPSFFLPGGPVTGAILGMGTGLLSKSDAFQEILFGKDFKTDAKKSLMNGAFGNLYKKTIGKATGSDNPKLAAFLGGTGLGVGLLQGVGLLPSFLLPGGPIIGSLLGLAGGIAASSNKFQEFLFGERDIDGKRYGGLLTKFTNWFDTTVITPFKIKMTEINDNLYGFVKGKMINPLIDAFEPLTQAFKFAVEDAKNGMKETWHKLTDGILNTFNENVIKPFGESLEKYVVDPLKKFFNKTLSLIGKALGTLVASPFKMIAALGNFANYKNERRVLKKERKERRQELKDALFADDFSFMNLGKAIGRQFMSKKQKDELLNRELPYRAEREKNRKEREESLQKEMEARKAKRDEMSRQFEEDRKFGKDNNWKYASKRQKEKREEELKQKQQWMQEQTLMKETEAVEKLEAVEKQLQDVPPEQVKQREILQQMADSLREVVAKLGKLNESSGEGEGGEGLGGRIMSNIRQTLQDNDQSHADGLDLVPSNGYLAELHEGEMVVPKKGASKIRDMFGSDDKKSGKKNKIVDMFSNFLSNEDGENGLGDLTEVITDKLSERLFGEDGEGGVFGTIFSKILGKGENVNTNPLNMTRNELETMKELQDRERYAQASRKNVDFVQEQIANRKKEKEEKKFRADLLSLLEKGFGDTKESSEEGNSLLEMLLGQLGSLLGPKGLLSLLGGASVMNWLNEKKNIAEENGISFWDALDGTGDKGQLNADGTYSRDNTVDVLTRHTVRHTVPKTARTIKKIGEGTWEAGKTVWNAGKSTWNAGKEAIGNLFKKNNAADAAQNTINGRFLLNGSNTGQILDDAGEVIGEATFREVENKGFLKTVGDNAKKAVTTLIDYGKMAIKKIGEALLQKFPKMKSIVGCADNFFAKMIKNADMIYKRFGKKIATYLADVGSSFIPIVGQVIEVGSVVWDVTTGLTAGNTAQLFKVEQNDVDIDMRTICSVMQGLCKLDFFSVVWLINEIFSSLYDFSFLTIIARAAYVALDNKLFGRHIDFSNDLSGIDVKTANLQQAIQQAGGDTSQFMDSKGNWIDISKTDTDKLTNISASEKQILANIQYNEKYGTQLDSQGYNDTVNKTVGQKILGSNWLKNTSGTLGLNKASVRGHLGLSKDAELTASDYSKNFKTKVGTNIYNLGANIFGYEKVDDAEVMQARVYDEFGFYVGEKNGVYTYAELRNIDKKKALDKANKKLEELEEKDGLWAGIQRNYYERIQKNSQSMLGESGYEDAAQAEKNAEDKKAKKKNIVEMTKEKKDWVVDKANKTKENVKEWVDDKKDKTKNKLKETEKKIDKAVDSSKEWISDKWDAGKDKLNKGIGAVTSAPGKAWDYLTSDAGENASTGRKAAFAVMKLNDIIDDTINEAVDGIKEGAKTFGKNVQKGFKNLAKQFGEIKDSVCDWFVDTKDTLEDGFKNMKKTFVDLKDGVSEWFVETGKNIKKTFNETIDNIGKNIKETMDKLEENFKEKFKELKENGEKIIKAVPDMMTNIKDKIIGFGDKLKEIQLPKLNFEKITLSAADAWEWVTGFFKDFLGSFSEAKDTYDGNDDDKENSVLSKVGGAIKDGYNGVKNLLGIGDNNAGGAGVQGNTSARLSANNNRESGFIQPTKTYSTTSNVNNNTTNNKYVFYSQNDRRWANKAIGDKNMAAAGCGPTSIAMAISQMTGEEITPEIIANMGKNELPGYSTYNLFPEIAKKFSMNYNDMGNREEMISQLRQGHPVILSGKAKNGNSPFTENGHIVVANSIDGNKVFVSDPRGKEYSRYYDIDDLFADTNRGFLLQPTKATKNKLGSSKGKITGINPQFIGTLNPNINTNGMSNSILSENMGSEGQIKLWEKVIGYARAFIGKLQYSYGSNAINNNGGTTDCSAFTSHVLNRAAGIDVGRSSSAQRSAGVEVPFDQAQAGDLVVWQGHVGLVSDSNKNMVDAGSGSVANEKSYVNSYWGKRAKPVIRRVLSNPNELVSPVVNNYHTGIGFSGTVGSQGGGDLSGGGAPGGTAPEGTTSTGISSGGAEAVEQMGVFGQLTKIAQNMVASIFNGRQVDMFGGSNTSTTGDNTTGDGTNPGDPNAPLTAGSVDENLMYSGTAGFFQALAPSAQDSYKKYNVFPSIMLAQAALESGWGKSAVAKSDKNLFGIKWTGRHAPGINVTKGKNCPGNEQGGARPYNRYESFGDSCIDHGWFLANNSPYKKMLASTDPDEQLKLLGSSGYAESGSYFSSLSKMINTYDLKKFNTGTNTANAGTGPDDELAEMYYDSEDLGPATATSAQAAPTDGSIPSSMNGWAYYSQSDPKWKGDVGGSSVSDGGCGPTSHAMMLTTVFGKEINPLTMTRWGRKNGTWTGAMQWTMPSKVSKEFGLPIANREEKPNGVATSSLQTVKNEIKAGRPVIMSGRGKSKSESPFTNGGHIVLGVGVDGNGNIIINDPRGPSYTRAYTDKEIMSYGPGLRGWWSFDTNGGKIPEGFETGSDFKAGAYSGTSTNPESADGTTGGGAEAVEQMGVFGQLTKIAQNMVASIFNGREVDMFGGSSNSSSTNSSGTPGETVDISSESDYATGVWKFFTGKGYSKEMTAGILGNMYQESGVDPTRIQGNGKGPAAGICQWENYNKKTERWKDMADHAASKGKEWTDLQSQLEFIDMELSGTAPRDNYTYSLIKKKAGGYDQFKSMTDINAATKMFEDCFERAGKPNMSRRYEAAKKYYNQFANTASGSSNMPGNAGMGEGDGKTYMIKPATSNKINKLAGDAGKGGDVLSKISKVRDNILQSVNTSEGNSVRNIMNNNIFNTSNLDKQCIELVNTIINELKAINTNTATTATNTSNLSIQSTNMTTSVNVNGEGRSTLQGEQVNVEKRRANDNTGYALARDIAQYIK